MDNQRRSHSSIPESAMELRTDGHNLYDYRTAHHRAGDPDYQTTLPETCVKCHRQAEIFETAGLDAPTKVDEEIASDE